MYNSSSFLRWPGKDEGLKDKALELAKEFVNRKVSFNFSEIERQALAPFFTNADQRIYLAHTLPAAISARALSRYSRMQNPRGLRGIFVDATLPELLALRIPEAAANPKAWLDSRDIKNLDQFRLNPEGAIAFQKFIDNFHCDPDYRREFASSDLIDRFFGNWIDKFGHDSIGRMAHITICVENVSLMAAKALEEARAGAGYMELSTRYVNMAGTDIYPIADLVRLFDPKLGKAVSEMIKMDFEFYRIIGDQETGIFPKFLVERYGNLFKDKERFKTAVSGEVCDVLGNLLPGAGLTSLGIAVDGEAFGSLLRHLLLHGSPETLAITEAVLLESEKTGDDQLARHYEPSEKEQEFWGFLDPRHFDDLIRSGERLVFVGSPAPIEPTFDLLRLKPQFADRSNEEISEMIAKNRENTDKLPPEFEAIGMSFRFVMSRRGERDLQRHVLAGHERTEMSPSLGFYRYDKPHPKEIDEAFSTVHNRNRSLDETLRAEPVWLRELVLSLGNLVGGTITMNLREAEFIVNQRSKPGVNHEVRQVALALNSCLTKAYSLWLNLSRANTTPAYTLARSAPPLPLETER
jgi:hypothetical protein